MFLVLCSYTADLIFGDPEWFPHPVRWMGRLIVFLDNKLRGTGGKWKERIKGLVLAVIVVGVSSSLAYCFIVLFGKIGPVWGSLAWIYLGYTTLSIKDLRIKARSVLEELEDSSIVGARKRLSNIVGRDTQSLNRDGIITAAIESIAENTNDGIVAPLFYLVVGGPVLAIAYKSVNTLDSMIGYRNEKYLHFGWFSARLDDVFNFIPARITGLLITVASFLAGGAWLNSLRVMLRDMGKHCSPNSGVSEAAMAGALGVKLGGPSLYSGKLSERLYLGEDRVPAEPFLIEEALIISFTVSVLMALGGIIIKWLV